MKQMKYHWIILIGLAIPSLALAESGADSDSSKVEAKAAAKSTKEKAKVDSPIQRLAEMRIDEFVVAARAINLPLPGKVKTVQDILDRFEKWSKDDKIGAVLLNLGGVGISQADVQEIRGGIVRLKKSGKKVSAFISSGSPSAYLIGCAADEVVMAPSGSLSIPGIGAAFQFLKGHYQMLGVEFEVISAGRFKYPGFLNQRDPSPYFLEEYNTILDGLIADYMTMIGSNRNLAPPAVKEAINIGLFNANQALQRGLVDHLAYYDECRDRILSRDKLRRMHQRGSGLASVNSIQDIMELMNDQLREQDDARKAVGPKIAVLHARGPIIDVSLGAGFATQVISRDDFVKVVDELRKNKSIKAVVLRIDSPGGSGYASDIIWKALKKLDEKKPLVVSMETVAGSGGYYIACPARRIFALPSTITGSIGVLGILPNIRSLYNRADYNTYEMTRGAHATLGAAHRSMTPEDRKFIQGYMDDFYSIFVDRVATGRRLPASEVRKIAEGRIYTGRQALAIGLVDELGGINEAIEAARKMANIPPSAELKILHYPRASSLGEFLESFGVMTGQQVLQSFMAGVTVAKPLSFDQQLGMLTQTIKPLCWMGMPAFYQPKTSPAVPHIDLFSHWSVPDPASQMLGLGR